MNSAVITGLGVISPLGNSVGELARRFASGTVANDMAEPPIDIIPQDKRARIGRLDRLCRFFLCASYLALDDAHLDLAASDPERIGLSFGTGLGCLLTNAEFFEKVLEQGPAAASPRLFAYTVSSAAAGEVSIALGIKGPNVTSHMGLAAGLGALGYGFDLIQMGKADVVLAGGADVIGPALLDGLRDMGLLKSPAAARPYRDAVPGMWPSEAAVIAVLERSDHALQRGARSWLRFDGYAAGFEPTLTRRSPELTGMDATVRRALAISGKLPDDVGVVMTSAHGTPLDHVERQALHAAFSSGSPVLLAPKEFLGDSFGATGCMSVALAAGLLQQGNELGLERAFDLNGSQLPNAEAIARLRRAPVVMINSLCYSGPIVAGLFGREP